MKKHNSRKGEAFVLKMMKCICIFIFCGSWLRLSSYKIQACYLLLCFLFAVVLVFCLAENRLIKNLKRLLLSLELIEILVLAGTVILHSITGYLFPTTDKGLETEFFRDKNVMIIVPHEDDDINLMGGAIENYIKGGSEVRVVFATNGDYYGVGELRLKEAINVLTQLGLPEENIIFLGYGDQWQPMRMPDGSDVKHIYNSMGNFVWTSCNQNQSTYGLAEHLPYHESEYTRENYLRDIEEVILEYRPEIIYANDYDTHIDHRAVSLLFEEAMGIILSETEEYTPVIYKGYCYETAWHAVDDFENVNIISTVESEVLSTAVYSWEDRVRIPVDNLAANKMLSQNSVYKALDGYASQQAAQRAGRIINGDKVFWRRRTDSILYSARITYDGSKLSELTDFKLIDSLNIGEKEDVVPENGTIVLKDNATINVQLSEYDDIAEICLYDNPNGESNILRGNITFDTGETVDFGALESSGNMTRIKCNVKNVKSFKIIICETMGEAPGLTEIEAYQSANESGSDEYIKIIDTNDNFCYDYWFEDNMQAFTIYSLSGDTDLGNYDIELQGIKKGNYYIKDNYIFIYCPVGEKGTLTITNGKVADSIRISNPTKVQRIFFTRIKNFDYKYAVYQNFFTKTYDYYRQIYIHLKSKLW